MDQPGLRDEFRQPDLRAWAHAHRADIVWAALVLGRSWIAAGRPRSPKHLGMFEDWAAVIGGVLEVAGIDGFLGNLREFYAASDLERSALQAFLGRWWERHRSRTVGVASLLELALEAEPPLDIGDRGERSQRTRLGLLVSKARDRQFRIVSGTGTALQVRVTRDGDAHNAHQSSEMRIARVLVGEGQRALPAGRTRHRAPGVGASRRQEQRQVPIGGPGDAGGQADHAADRLP